MPMILAHQGHHRRRRDARTCGNLLRWKATGTGPLSSNVGEAGAFCASRDDLELPDIQLHVAPTGFYDNGLHEPDAAR